MYLAVITVLLLFHVKTSRSSKLRKDVPDHINYYCYERSYISTSLIIYKCKSNFVSVCYETLQTDRLLILPDPDRGRDLLVNKITFISESILKRICRKSNLS